MIRHPIMSGSDGSNPPPRSGNVSSGKSKGDAARAERLRAALRENLKRRKSQARGRSQAGQGVTETAAHDSAGFVPEKATDKARD
jgi:hypothetical protein